MSEGNDDTRTVKGEDDAVAPTERDTGQKVTVVAALKEMFADETDKRFEWLAKQYYDLFSYHAAQRLTAFNFFIVSLSFFSNAFAMFVTRTQGNDTYFELAAGLAIVAWLLTLFFARLDKRNEQIIQINEKPLKRMQQAVAEHFEDQKVALHSDGDGNANVFRTFREADKSYPLRTFGSILPWLFTLAAAACLTGAAYATTKTGLLPFCAVIWGWIGLLLVTLLVVHRPLFPQRQPQDA